MKYWIVFCLLPITLTLSRHLGQLKEQNITDEEEKEEEQRAKKISNNLSSLKLNKIPHRIYLAGNEIIKGFDEQLSKNHVEMKFTYELVEPRLCEVFNPPFGCCWDNRTVALGPNGEGCPACKNEKHRKCRKWKDQCSSQVIKDICPETCNICPKQPATDPNCQDAPDQEKYCSLYSKFGLCARKSIKLLCQRSCKACKLSFS